MKRPILIGRDPLTDTFSWTADALVSPYSSSTAPQWTKLHCTAPSKMGTTGEMGVGRCFLHTTLCFAFPIVPSP